MPSAFKTSRKTLPHEESSNCRAMTSAKIRFDSSDRPGTATYAWVESEAATGQFLPATTRYRSEAKCSAILSARAGSPNMSVVMVELVFSGSFIRASSPASLTARKRGQSRTWTLLRPSLDHSTKMRPGASCAPGSRAAESLSQTSAIFSSNGAASTRGTVPSVRSTLNRSVPPGLSEITAT